MTCFVTWETIPEGAGNGIIWYKTPSGGSAALYKYAHNQHTEDNITIGMGATTFMSLTAGDIIELYVFQGSGATRTLQANNSGSGTNYNSNYWAGFLIG